MANNLPTEKKALVVSMLAEGASIRGIERITNVNRNTIMNLGVRVGEACARIHDEKMRGLNCSNMAQKSELTTFASTEVSLNLERSPI